MARWPLHPAPLDDEPLSSWLSRLAAAYEMEPMVFCHDMLALTNQSLQELDERVLSQSCFFESFGICKSLNLREPIFGFWPRS